MDRRVRVLAASQPAAQRGAPPIESLLDKYDRGDYVAVSRSLEQVAEARDLDRLDSDLQKTAESWIQAAAPEQRVRRTFVAGALALELTHAVTVRESWFTDRARGSAILILRSLPALGKLIRSVPRSSERLSHDWMLASLATWQEWIEITRLAGADSLLTPEPGWAVLLGRPRLIDFARLQDAIGGGGCTDNGTPQQVEAVAAAAIPLDVSLIVDTTFTGILYGVGANAANESDIQRSVSQMAATLGTADRLEVLGYEADILERRPMSPVDSAVDTVSVRTTGAFTKRSAITGVVLTALTASVAPDRRHLVVLFALGTGTPTVAPLEHLVPVARRADALLYAVLPPPHHEDITNRPFPFYPSEVVIRDAVTKAAEATGGKAYSTGDIVGAFRDILKAFRSSYVLRYTLQGVPSAGWHDIVVTVPGCPTCTISARRGYMGG